jgi:hypothetical protein
MGAEIQTSQVRLSTYPNERSVSLRQDRRPPNAYCAEPRLLPKRPKVGGLIGEEVGLDSEDVGRV